MLVVIGLLVGGVLQGQELIKQAYIREEVKAIGQLKLAFNQFQVKYNGLPGDIRSPERFFPDCNKEFSGGTVNDKDYGNGDGYIRSYLKDGVGYTEFSCVWMQLHNSGLYEPIAPKAAGVHGSYPERDIDFSVDSFAYALWPYGTIPTSIEVFSEYFSMNYVRVVGSFGPTDMSELDRKMDDGRPQSGSIRSIGGDCFDNAYDNKYPTSASEYLTAETGECIKLFMLN